MQLGLAFDKFHTKLTIDAPPVVEKEEAEAGDSKHTDTNGSKPKPAPGAMVHIDSPLVEKFGGSDGVYGQAMAPVSVCLGR